MRHRRTITVPRTRDSDSECVGSLRVSLSLRQASPGSLALLSARAGRSRPAPARTVGDRQSLALEAPSRRGCWLITVGVTVG